MNDQAKIKIVSICISAISVIFALISFFLLPSKIFVELLGNGRVPETNSVVFLLIGSMIVILSGLMCFFNENGKKWIALQSVLALAFNGCLIYNLIVL